MNQKEEQATVEGTVKQNTVQFLYISLFSLNMSSVRKLLRFMVKWYIDTQKKEKNTFIER